MNTPPSETQQRTPLGDLLENARVNVLQITGREAARRAHISETRWRQVVTGWQAGRGGTKIPATPKVRTVLAMAQAVNVDVRQALTAAGIQISDQALAVLLEEARTADRPTADMGYPTTDVVIDIQYEIERVGNLNVPARTKLSLIKKLLDLHEEAEADRQRVEKP